MPDFDLDAALSSPGNPDRNRTGQCVCGIPKNFDDAYCPACLHARVHPVSVASRQLDAEGVVDLHGVCNFAVWMWSRVGMGFHPDTPIDDYINLDTGELTFDRDETETAEMWRQDAFRVAEDEEADGGAFDIYDACMEAQMGYARRILRAAGVDAVGLTMPEVWQKLCELGDPQGPPI